MLLMLLFGLGVAVGLAGGGIRTFDHEHGSKMARHIAAAIRARNDHERARRWEDE